MLVVELLQCLNDIEARGYLITTVVLANWRLGRIYHNYQ